MLVTCHRQENTDYPERVAEIISALSGVLNNCLLFFSLYPRARKRFADLGIEKRLNRLCVIEPVSYLEMIALE